MKTKSNKVRLMFATAALGALASFAHAGPPPDIWNRTKPITTTKEAAAIKSGETVIMVCGACKTVAINEAIYLKRSGAEIDDYGYEWFTIGSKHKCDHCGGEITVVKGKTADSMQHNCSKCGEEAAFCCAAAPGKK